MKRKHSNLYSSATGDWLTFTSPVERRKRVGETEGGGGGETRGREGEREGEEQAGFDRPTRQDGCV